MKAIYSLYIGKNATRNNQFCGYRCKEELLDALLLSSSFSAKNFDKVELYCDSEAAQLIKEDGRIFPLNIVVCLDSLSWLNEYLWAYSKVFVYSLQFEPFCHIDIDAILWNGLPKEVNDKKFLFQQVESLSMPHFQFYHKPYEETEMMGILPVEISYKPAFALNMAVFACIDANYLFLVKKYFNVVDEYVRKANNRLHEYSQIQHQCILFEQLFIVNILESANLSFEIDYEVIINENYSEKWKNCRYTHLIVDSKKTDKNVQRIKRLLQNLDKLIG